MKYAAEEAKAPGVSAGSFRAVTRAMQVLTALSQQPAASVSEVAQRVGLNRAATHRVLRALEEAGAVARARGGYHLGPLVFELGKRVPFDKILAEASRAPLEELTRQFGEATHVSVLSRYETQIVFYSASYRSTSFRRRVGLRLPSYQGSPGKVLLAAAPAADLQRYLASTKLLPATRNTITNPTALLKELDTVRAQGFAINRAEHDEGQTSVSVPVRGFDGEWLAAIALSAPSSRMTEDRLPEIIDALNEKSAVITRTLFRQAAHADQILHPAPEPETVKSPRSLRRRKA